MKKIFVNFATESLEMIQRKQSIYLLIVALLAGIAIFASNLWVFETKWIQPKDDGIILGMFLISAILPLITLFLYKDRKLQMNLVWGTLILNILLIGYLTYCLSNLPGGFSDSEKGVGLFVPFTSIVLLLLANRLIKKDELLVKSVDRFR